MSGWDIVNDRCGRLWGIYWSLYLLTSHTGCVVRHVTLSLYCLGTSTSHRVHYASDNDANDDIARHDTGLSCRTDGNLVSVNCGVSPVYIKLYFIRPVTSFRRRGVRFPLKLYLQKMSYYEHECISSLTHMRA